MTLKIGPLNLVCSSSGVFYSCVWSNFSRAAVPWQRSIQFLLRVSSEAKESRRTRRHLSSARGEKALPFTWISCMNCSIPKRLQMTREITAAFYRPANAHALSCMESRQLCRLDACIYPCYSARLKDSCGPTTSVICWWHCLFIKKAFSSLCCCRAPLVYFGQRMELLERPTAVESRKATRHGFPTWEAANGIFWSCS